MILLVDDEPAVREATRSILESADFQVIEASCADDALEILERKRPLPSLLLTDIVMPGISGLALAAEAHRRWPGLHVLFLSGFTREFAGDLSGTVCVSKPFQPAELVVAVQSALEPKTDM